MRVCVIIIILCTYTIIISIGDICHCRLFLLELEDVAKETTKLLPQE